MNKPKTLQQVLDKFEKEFIEDGLQIVKEGQVLRANKDMVLLFDIYDFVKQSFIAGAKAHEEAIKRERVKEDSDICDHEYTGCVGCMSWNDLMDNQSIASKQFFKDIERSV